MTLVEELEQSFARDKEASPVFAVETLGLPGRRRLTLLQTLSALLAKRPEVTLSLWAPSSTMQELAMFPDTPLMVGTRFVFVHQDNTLFPGTLRLNADVQSG